MQEYRYCPIDHWSQKHQQTVEEKATVAAKYTAKIEIAATRIICNLYCTYDVAMIRRFLDGLHFINDHLNEYSEEYFRSSMWPEYPLNIFYQCQQYYPHLLEMFQHDCHALLTDIIGFMHSAHACLLACKNAVKLNKYIRFACAVDYYLNSVKERNPALWDDPPKHITQKPVP